MHKVIIYKTPGGYALQNLTGKTSSQIYRTLRQLVNDCFKNYHSFLVKKYGEEFADDRLKYIVSYLKNWLNNFSMQVIEFPGDLNTGEVNQDRKTMSSLSESLFYIKG